MTHTLPNTTVGEVPSELTSSFARRLSAIRRRLQALRAIRGSPAAIERRCLLQQEAAWQLGILLLQRAVGDETVDVVEILDANACHGGPAGDAFAAMAAMVAIRTLWATALRTPESHHPAQGGLNG